MTGYLWLDTVKRVPKYITENSHLILTSLPTINWWKLNYPVTLKYIAPERATAIHDLHIYFRRETWCKQHQQGIVTSHLKRVAPFI
jgi:hypothetical protein